MYIDVDCNVILATLPNSYKSTSNFNAMTDAELESLNVYKIQSFIEDNEYFDFLHLVGTEFYPSIVNAVPGNNHPGNDVKVLLDSETIITQVAQNKGYDGEFRTVQDVLLNRPIITYDVELDTEIIYNYSKSYVFVVFGTSDLLPFTKESPTNFKYTLMCNAPSVLPNLEIGDVLIQEGTGFSGKVSYIDTLTKVVKLINCNNIELIDRFKSLKLGTTDLGPIFCYELYLQTNDIEYTNTPQETSLDLISKGIYLYNLFSHPGLTYLTKYECIVGDELDSLVKIESSEIDLSEFNTRKITDYGRYI